MGPCAHVTFSTTGPTNDEAILACAKGYQPEVIFYIGANGGVLPTTDTFKELRNIAPCIHYQTDVEAEAWFDLLKQYRREGCFDLIVGQTGVKTDLVDMATLMAIDVDAFKGAKSKNMLCGFSGTACDLSNYFPGISEWDGRAEILKGLSNHISFRPREPVGSYKGHVDFLKRCVIALNVSYTGLGTHHHVKWRVLEAAFADCVLLEMKDSPTKDWFPESSYLVYETIDNAKRIIKYAKISEMTSIASQFSSYARKHYMPRQIFNSILGAL